MEAMAGLIGLGLMGLVWQERCGVALYPDSCNLGNDQESIQLSPETAVP